jgi:hypothetical protein
MTIQDSNFIYAGQSSEEFSVIMVDFDSPSATNDENSELILSTTPYRNTWSLHAVQKSEPLKFRITLCRTDGEYIDAYMERELKKWLCKGSFNWLSIDQTDLSDSNYFCVINNPQKVNVARMNGGMSFEVCCNSQNAWSNLRTKTYTSTTTNTFNFYNDSDYNNYELSPTFTIASNASQNIKIKNNTTNQEVIINNCLQNEVIILDSENEMISTTVSRNIIDDWNVVFTTMTNGTNTLTMTGNFTMRIEYRLPIRIGG